MAKSAKNKPPVEGEKEQTKKRGLFSFLRRKKKNPEENQAVETGAVEQEILVDAAPKDAKSKAPVKKPSKSASKPATKAATKKVATKKAAKPAAAKKPAIAKASAGKKTVKRPSKKVPEADIAALETAEDDAVVEKPKRKLFGFLKRKKKLDPTADPVTDNVIAAKSKVDLDEQDVPKKKGLFGFLKRKKKTIEPSEADLGVAIKAAAKVDAGKIEAGEEDATPKKKSFLSKKIILIIVGIFSVTGATGAAAVVFAGPMIFGEDIKGLACEVVFETDFELMREQRVTSFIRADIMPPKQRVLMVIQYAKYLAELYPDSQLVSVSVLDTNGPVTRPNFRGSNIGAQAVFAADPLLTQATKQTWEVRYINADKTYSGKFLGDRYELSEDEISALRTEIIEPSGCFVPEIELTDEEIEEKEKLEAKELAAAEKAAEMAAEALALQEADMETMAAVHAEPGMIDNLLGIVGLGGSDEATGEMTENMDGQLDAQDNVPLEESNANAFPGDKHGVPEILYEEDKGFFDGVLGMVGLGSDGHEMNDAAADDILGTKVSYN